MESSGTGATCCCLRTVGCDRRLSSQPESRALTAACDVSFRKRERFGHSSEKSNLISDSAIQGQASASLWAAASEPDRPASTPDVFRSSLPYRGVSSSAVFPELEACSLSLALLSGQHSEG